MVSEGELWAVLVDDCIYTYSSFRLAFLAAMSLGRKQARIEQIY